MERLDKGFATEEMILTIGILIAAGILLLELRGVFYGQTKLSQEEVASSVADDLENIVNKINLFEGNATFAYHPTIKSYTLTVKNNNVLIYDKTSKVTAGFTKTNVNLQDMTFEDSEVIYIKKDEDKIYILKSLEDMPKEYLTDCDSTCKLQGHTSGSCRNITAGTPDTNLAPMPGNWGPGGYGGGTQNLFIDYNVLSPSGKPSWRVEAYTDGDESTPISERVGNYWRECISQPIPNDYKTNPLKVGDYIVVKYWIRTGPSTIGKDGIVPSSVIGVWDYRNDVTKEVLYHYGQVREHNSNVMVYSSEYGWEYKCDIDGTKEDVLPEFVPMNTIALYPETNGWVQRTLTGRVPPLGRILNYDGSAWSSTLPTFFIVALNAGSYQFWDSVQQKSYQDEGLVWFADAEVYINPTCQFNEKSIGQDGCSSGNACCCSG